MLFAGADTHGPIAVKVYGRDAWDAQLLANLWRAAWYRGTQRTARLSRLELVEHEGFMTLLADRAGVRVPHLVTAGSAGRGDALVVVRPDGVPASTHDGEIGDDAIAGLWSELERLNDAGISHRQLDLDRLVVRPDGSLGFGDLSSASVTESEADTLHDRAQLLGLSVLLVGEERATAVARRVLGDEAPARRAAVPAGSGDVRAGPRRPRATRTSSSTTSATGCAPRSAPRSSHSSSCGGSPAARCSTWPCWSIAAYALITVFGNLDIEEVVDDLRDASWWWLAFAVILAQIPRAPSAVSTKGSIDTPLPFGPLFALQFAICYINLAIPSTAARVAVNVRFFQRFGVKPTEAMAAGVIDSVSGFIVQIVLFLLLFTTSDLDFGMSLDTSRAQRAGDDRPHRARRARRCGGDRALGAPGA